MRSLLLFAALAVAFQSAPPSQTAASVLADARTKMAANDLDGAAKVLETFLAANPASFRALNLLGSVRQQQKQYDAAIDAYTKSHAADTSRGNAAAIYNIATIWALKGDADRTFEWLQKAKADGRIDLSLAAVDPNMVSIRKDARLTTLLPKPEIFEQSFVEDVKVLYEWRGEGPNDNFGWIARNIGDVDADGVNDVVTSSPSYSRSGDPNASPGRIYVYSTKRNKVLWSADGEGRDSLGVGIEAAGDTNRDGIPDVIASAPGGGYAKVYSGRDGKVLLTMRAENRSDQFGRHASGAGDVNRDGYADVIVGAPGSNAGGQGAGRAYVYSGRDGALLLTLTGERAGDALGSAVTGGPTKTGFVIMAGAPGGGPRQTGRVYVYDTLDGKAKFTMDSDETGAAFGAMFLSLPGDMNRDGVGDLYVSDWVNAAKGPQTGRVYVYSGKDGSRLHAWTGDAQGDGLGTTQAIAGDVDGDGYADLLVGAWQHSSAAPSGGRVSLYSGKDGRVLKTYTCRTPFDTFGFDGVTLGDVNGDGAADFLITSGYSAVNGYHSGRVFVISGK